MTARKPEPTNWVNIINAVFAGITGLALMYMNSTLNKVQRQTDGTHTAAKLAVAISAEALAAATKSPRDIKVAEEARAAYEAQLQVQLNAEK